MPDPFYSPVQRRYVPGGMLSGTPGMSGPGGMLPGTPGMSGPGGPPIPSYSGGAHPDPLSQPNYGMPYDPKNPWGGFANDPRGGVEGQSNRMIGWAGNAGVYDPSGNSALLDALRAMYEHQGIGADRSALMAARNNGADPSTYGFAALMAHLNGQSNLANAMGTARSQSALQNQGFLQNLYNSQNEFSNWLRQAHTDYAVGRVQGMDQRNAHKGSLLGGILGAAAGGLGTAIGGPIGGAIGKRLGG